MQSNYKPNSTNGISLLFPSFKAKIDLQFKLVGSFFVFVQITYELLSLGGCNYYLVKVGRRKSREIHTGFLILSKAHWGHILTKELSYFFNFYQISKHCFRNAQLFWEGHKNLRTLPHGFDLLLSKGQNHEEDCAKFFGLLRKAELYWSLFNFYALKWQKRWLSILLLL